MNGVWEDLLMMGGFVSLLGFGFICILVFAWYFWRLGRRAVWRRLQSDGPRCPKCGYDLQGQSELRCPECGERWTLGELWIAQRDSVTDSDK
jgi:predicted RNA-binding Zn-ribbon protein involved in translation (DUF1610 family)